MKRVLTIFVILAVISLALLIQQRREQKPSDLAESLMAAPAAAVSEDRVSTSSAAAVRMSGQPATLSQPLSPEDSQKLSILEQILTSRNDNDPRLDRELRQLSGPLKSAMIARYQQLPLESRNERGTVVFLIGRNLNRPEDYAFFSDVLREPACLSLADCKTHGAAGSAGDEAGANDVTLAYPQWVALRSLERSLGGPQEAPATGALEAGTHSPNHAISQRASELLRRINGHG